MGEPVIQGTGEFHKQKEGSHHQHRDDEWLREIWRNIEQVMCGATISENLMEVAAHFCLTFFP